MIKRYRMQDNGLCPNELKSNVIVQEPRGARHLLTIPNPPANATEKWLQMGKR